MSRYKYRDFSFPDDNGFKWRYRGLLALIALSVICSIGFIAHSRMADPIGEKTMTVKKAYELTEGKQQLPTGVNYETATHIMFDDRSFVYVRNPIFTKEGRWRHYPPNKNALLQFGGKYLPMQSHNSVIISMYNQ